MLADFHSWAARKTQTNLLPDLKDSVVAIEAEWYLDRILMTDGSRESLLPALGGLPFTLRKTLNAELAAFKEAGITPIFIFNGMDVGNKYRPFSQDNEVARRTADAWALYLQAKDSEQSVKQFGNSGETMEGRARGLFDLILKHGTGAQRAPRYQKLFQQILRQANVDFQVAPYSARGQLAYFLKHGKSYVDAVAGSSELLLFDVDKVIVKFDFEPSAEFSFVRRADLIEEFGGIKPDMLVDAFLLAGSDILQPLPQLVEAPLRRGYRIFDAVDFVKLHGSGINVCQNFKDDPAMRRTDYLDRFRRTRLAIKHSFYHSAEGKVEPFESESAPNDLHLVVGQRLPDELFYYIWCGAISPRVPNQLTTGVIYETCPLDGGESEAYRQLIQNKLTPLRSTSLALIAGSLTRAYQHREVKVSCWFDNSRDPSQETSIKLRDIPSPTPIINTWHVYQDIIKTSALPIPEKINLSFALQSLKETDFAAKTITKKEFSDTGEPKILTTPTEVTANVLWRFLHLSGYLNDKHQLTSWGHVLDSILTTLQSDTSTQPLPSQTEEAAFLACELLRHDLLTTSDLFPTYLEPSLRGSETEKRNTMFVARLCCLSTLRHKDIGYSGPLSRHLLGFTSAIDAIRTSSRDLLETCLATLFLNGDATRDRADFADLAFALPFLLPTDCAAGVVVRCYLSQLVCQGDPSSASVREAVKNGPERFTTWFGNAVDVNADLEGALKLWDAVVKGVRVASDKEVLPLGGAGATGGKSQSARDRWEAIDVWVQKRR